MNSPAGARYKRCADLKFALREHFSLSLNDVTVEEFRDFQIATSEQEKHEARKKRADGK